MTSNMPSYRASVAIAAMPISTWTAARAKIRSRKRSTCLRTHSPPMASPKMNAASMSSKAWVEAPTTSESIRIQTIS